MANFKLLYKCKNCGREWKKEVPRGQRAPIRKVKEKVMEVEGCDKCAGKSV